MDHSYSNKDLPYLSKQCIKEKRGIEKLTLGLQKSLCNKIGGVINIHFFLPLIFAYQKSQSLGSKLHLCAAAWLRGCINARRWLKMQITHFCASPRSPLRVYYPPTVLVWYQRYLQFLPPPKANHINPLLKDTCFIEARLLFCCGVEQMCIIREWLHLTDWDYIHGGRAASEDPA